MNFKSLAKSLIIVGLCVPMASCANDFFRSSDNFSMAINHGTTAKNANNSGATSPRKIRTASKDATPASTKRAPRTVETRATRTSSIQPASTRRQQETRTASNNGASNTTANVVPAQRKVASGNQVLAALMRSWNKIALPQASSKTLFGVWPEEIDGSRPDASELAKRQGRG